MDKNSDDQSAIIKAMIDENRQASDEKINKYDSKVENMTLNLISLRHLSEILCIRIKIQIS